MVIEKSDQAALLSAVRLAIKTACKVVEFPDNVSFSVDEEDSTVLTFKSSNSKTGKIIIQYTLPEDKLGKILEQSAIDFCSILPQKVAESAALELLGARIIVFLRAFSLETEQNFESSWDISNLLYEKLSKKNKSIETLTREEQTALANDFADNGRMKAKKVFEKFLMEKGKETLHWDLLQNIIAYFYNLVLPEWKAAKQHFKQNKHLKDWQKRVDAVIGIHLPADLLEKLADIDKYESEAGYLAAQHAARICLMPQKGRFSIKEPRRFKKRIAESSKWIKENPQQADYLIDIVEKKASFMRTDSVMRYIWENPDNSLAYNAPVPNFLTYIDEFFYLTERKQKLNSVMDGVTIHSNND